MLFGKTTANHVSRFVLEIPEADISGRSAPKVNRSGMETSEDSWGDGWDDVPAGRAGGRGGFAVSGGRRGFGGYSRPVNPKSVVTPAPKPKIAFKKGDAVVHKVFGAGVVTEVTPVGNDALMEVAFKDEGTKRLMANAASRHMTLGE
jgi:DNA helicase-2/ATP-dependent DNA helicase PcrA